MREAMYFYKPIFEAINSLPEQPMQLKLYEAVIRYGLYDEEPRFQGVDRDVLEALFMLMKPQLDRGKKIIDTASGRTCKEYVEWRTAVFERDDYTCRCCRKRGVSLNAHHIKQYAYYPGLRYEVSNGITLCEKCHRNIHKKGRK